MSEYIGLDYETWSRTNLPVKGLHNYVIDPEFKVLLASGYSSGGAVTYDFVYGVVRDRDYGTSASSSVAGEFRRYLDAGSETIMAHNAGFERAVTKHLFPDFDVSRFSDSAVDSRLLGAESKLEVASRQLTDSHKLEAGNELVMLFCVPNELYPDGPTPELIAEHGHEDKWQLFIDYCEMDAQGSRDIRLTAIDILKDFDPTLLQREDAFEYDCYLMNQAGWHVDVPLVEKMKQRAWANSIIAQRSFVNDTGDQINFNSPIQLKKYCEKRGVKVKSLDKYNLPVKLDEVKRLILEQEGECLCYGADGVTEPRCDWCKTHHNLKEVEALLETKAEIGGSALSKLPKILDLIDDEGILRDQYMHLGAGQTFRTTGKGVQMQNIARLSGDIRDMSTVFDLKTHWSNGDMASQIRQVFTSRHPEGQLIVGDFSSVESRALAWEAQEDWKIDTYREGKDVYKVLASMYFDVPYDEVTSEQRPRGKYSELSCGYQAGAKALQNFMFRLGFVVKEEIALEDVQNWRTANSKIEEFWGVLDDVLRTSVQFNQQIEKKIGNGLTVRTTPFTLPSVQEVRPGSVSLALQILLPNGKPFVTRFIHGLTFIQGKLVYLKPADRNNGPLWKETFSHPTLKNQAGKPLDVHYSVYGGKLAGIFTQSFCREMFMESINSLGKLMKDTPNAQIIGQFHDEIVVDWWPDPNGQSLDYVKSLMDTAMSETRIEGFPLVADIKNAYRYIK